MVWTLEQLRTKLDRCKFRRDDARAKLAEISSNLIHLQNYLESLRKAQALCQTVAMQTQESLRYHVEDVVNLMLQTLFGNQYEFKLIFEIKRNKTEARIAVLEKGVELDPLFSTGGGLADALSTALRIALMMLSKAERVLVLDEPGKFLDVEKRPQFYAILQKLSKDMNIQMLIVTHDPDCVEIADKEFKIVKSDGISYVI